jgi:hypothetical protein
MLDGEGEAIVRRAIEGAKAGEPLAMKLCIERILPRRANVVEMILPEIRSAVDVCDATAAVIEAAAAGRATLGEAKEFLHLLDLHRRSIETHELAVRIELLERGADPPTPEQLARQLEDRLERARPRPEEVFE